MKSHICMIAKNLLFMLNLNTCWYDYLRDSSAAGARHHTGSYLRSETPTIDQPKRTNQYNKTNNLWLEEPNPWGLSGPLPLHLSHIYYLCHLPPSFGWKHYYLVGIGTLSMDSSVKQKYSL